jgi:immune inhibitor A
VGGAFNADGTSIFAYLTVPEDSRIGVCAHELGHLLFGWPDLYDTDSSSEGLGNWCLMAGGSWNSNGDVPAHPSAWCKVNQGWASVQTHTANGVVSIADVKTSHTVHRLWKDGAPGNEYFLLENRQRTGFDTHLPGDGLLVYHVDEAIATNANENHPKVKLMEADGQRHLHNGANRGDAGDSYPGSSGNTAFNGTSNPNSKSYGNVDTCVAITNIGPSGPTMSARLAVRCAVKPSKELTKEKEFKEGKELRKEIRKEFIKEKEFKELKEKEVKEFKEFKEKDKDIFEKPGEGRPGRPGDRGLSGGSEAAGDAQTLSSRVEALEQFARTVEPFIGGGLRPDVGSGALQAEEDLSDIISEMRQGSAFAKRSFDTKPSDK